MGRIVAIAVGICLCCSVAAQKPVPKERMQFGRYSADNAAVMESGVRPDAVFIGDSIFECWADCDSLFFADHNFIARGISGQTSSQMLVRFRRDVLDLAPRAVVIMAGTNDVAQNEGAIALENILGNIESMCEIAERHKIRVVLCSVPPAVGFRWRTGVERPAEKIATLNGMISGYAAERGLPYVDLHAALADEHGGMPAKWSKDGVHPNNECYREVFEPMVYGTLQRVLHIKERRTEKRNKTSKNMIYPIVVYGSPVLRKESVEIDASYPDFKKLVEDMFMTLTEASGVGLAAPQIGKNIRMFIVDCTPWGDENPELADYRRVFVNPQIYERSEQTDLFEEGCLSLPGIHENVRRPVTIRMRYLDENFEAHDEEFTGLPARVIQHEYDHIEGKVFTDHLSPLRRNLLKGKILNLAKGKYRCDYKTK